METDMVDLCAALDVACSVPSGSTAAKHALKCIDALFRARPATTWQPQLVAIVAATRSAMHTHVADFEVFLVASDLLKLVIQTRAGLEACTTEKAVPHLADLLQRYGLMPTAVARVCAFFAAHFAWGWQGDDTDCILRALVAVLTFNLKVGTVPGATLTAVLAALEAAQAGPLWTRTHMGKEAADTSRALLHDAMLHTGVFRLALRVLQRGGPADAATTTACQLMVPVVHADAATPYALASMGTAKTFFALTTTLCGNLDNLPLCVAVCDTLHMLIVDDDTEDTFIAQAGTRTVLAALVHHMSAVELATHALWALTAACSTLKARRQLVSADVIPKLVALLTSHRDGEVVESGLELAANVMKVHSARRAFVALDGMNIVLGLIAQHGPTTAAVAVAGFRAVCSLLAGCWLSDTAADTFLAAGGVELVLSLVRQYGPAASNDDRNGEVTTWGLAICLNLLLLARAANRDAWFHAMADKLVLHGGIEAALWALTTAAPADAKLHACCLLELLGRPLVPATPKCTGSGPCDPPPPPPAPTDTPPEPATFTAQVAARRVALVALDAVAVARQGLKTHLLDKDRHKACSWWIDQLHAFLGNRRRVFVLVTVPG